jgi:hypothetical protein
LKDSDKLYLGFRDFVVTENLKDYDNDYFSRKKPSYKFMIPFINKYINIETLKNQVTDTSQTRLITFFLNDYCLRNSKIIKSLNKIKDLRTTVERNFLFK